jgi:hypothetical protein
LSNEELGVSQPAEGGEGIDGVGPKPIRWWIGMDEASKPHKTDTGIKADLIKAVNYLEDWWR